MNAFLIDDRLSAIDALRALLEAYCPDVHIAGTATRYQDAVEQLLSRTDIDVIFCDVDLGGHTGFDILDKLQGYRSSIIIVSAFNEFALKAFQYDAINYLTKPVSPHELMKAVERARIWHKANAASGGDSKLPAINTISVYVGGKWIIIPHEQITHIKSHQNYSHIYVKDQPKAYISSYGLGYFQEKLQHSLLFVRVQKSYIINRQHLVSISAQGASLELVNNVTVPIGGGVYRTVMSKLLGR